MFYSFALYSTVPVLPLLPVLRVQPFLVPKESGPLIQNKILI
jgi:hypothetical protein